MKRRIVVVIVVGGLIAPGLAWAQRSVDWGTPVEKYPEELLEEYHECMERNDLGAIKELLWFHLNVEKIDASVYGLPVSDFDDQSLLTINERLRYREERNEVLARRPDEPRQATRGALQYPHHLRNSLDHFYEIKGERPDCSEILNRAGVSAPPRGLGSGWASDLDLTTFDSNDRGEVDIVLDYANPNRIMASSVSSGGSPEGTSNLILYSADWGQTWNATGVGNNSGTSWECDPVSYYQRSTGNVYHSKIGCNTGTCGETYTMIRYSTNNGAAWADCGRPDSGTSEDRQWHVVDNTPTSACYGNIYVTWHNSNQEKVSASSNNCANWGSVTNLTGTFQAITPDINVAADGHAYVVWQNYGDATFKIAGSSDCGATWTSPSPKTVKTRLGDWKNNIPAQCQRGISTLPNVDVDRCAWSAYYGRVYMAMFDFDQSGCGTGPGCSDWSNSCDYDVWFSYSDDQGQTWSSAVNITRDILGHGDRVDSFMGYMRVDESDGSIYIGYHRTRLNPASLADREKTHYFLARSIDGGTTWEEIQLSTQEGDEKVSGASSFERGDYNHIDVFEGAAYPVWIDRRGTTAEENIITRKVCTEPAHRSERAPTFTAPSLTLTSPGAGTVDISWAGPDAQWGDGGENNAARKYQLWVDGSLAQDNIAWTATSISSYDPGDCDSHSYFIRAINQCAIFKDYATANFSATGCCTGNPTSVDVIPDGPLTLCAGTGQTLNVSLTGGTAPFTYQWSRDGIAISGATASTYNANDTGTHTYNCEVTGGGCSPGVQDSSDTQITWQSEPDFSGVDSVTNAQASTCTLDLAWTAATSPCGGTISYNIYRSTTSGFTPGAGNQIAGGVSGTSYSDADSLVSGTTYYYVVRAVSSANGVEDSNSVERSAAPTGASGGNQTLHSDDYENAATWGDWTVTTGPGPHSCGDWARSNSASQRPSAGSGYYALSDSDACGSGSTTSTTLTSPVIDCTAVIGNADLSYDIYYNHYNGDDATVEVWDGASWVVIWSDGDADINTSHLWDVTAYAAGNPAFQYRFNYQNAAWDYWFSVDNVLLTGDVAAVCTTGGGCTDPGAVTIDSITDNDDCAQDGVTISFSGGAGATSFDLYVDGSLAQSGISSPQSFNPGDAASHSYVVRAVNGSCFTDSGASNFTDADNTPGTPAAPSVADDDACLQNGVTVTWGAVGGATGYDLRVDGGTIVTGVASPYSYNPGDSASHTYEVRATNGTCGAGAWSGVTTATDEEGSPGTPAAPTVADVADCALTGVQISWGAVSGATSYDLLVDGATTVTGVSSPYTYAPGDSASHTYQVRAVNICGNGTWSTGTAGVDGDYSFTWAGIDTAADRDACDDTGVAIQWSTPANWNDGGTGSRTFTVSRNGSPLTSGIGETIVTIDDTTGVNGTTYNYSVEAFNGYGCSAGGSVTRAASDEVGSEPTFGGLQSVAAMPGDVCGLRLDWNAATSNCANGPTIVYNVYRSTTSGFTPNATTLLSSCVAELFYEDDTVTGGTTYYYVVQAEDSSLGHGGPCGDGFEDTNTTQVSGMVSSGPTTATVYADDFDGNQTPADYWNTGFSMGNPYTTGLCSTETFADDWHLPESGGSCTGNSAASNDGISPYAYSSPNNGTLVLGDPPVGGGPPYSDGGILLPVGASSITLTFNHDYDFENGDWDGGRVMISVDDWPTFTAITPVGGYPGTTVDSTSYCHPWPNTAAYVNNSGGCVLAEFDLTAYAGQRIWLAWNHGADNWDTGDDGWFIDDVLIQATVPGSACSTAADPVQHFAARSTSGTAKLEWRNPAGGAYSATRICVDTTGFPTDPTTCTLAGSDQAAGLDSYDTMTLTGLTNGQSYYYAAFVDDGSGQYSSAQTVVARPFDTTGTTKWAYHTSASALAPPGLYPGAAGTGASYGVSNDRVLHSMNATTGGGDWPRTAPFSWMPMGMNGPAQARPPIVPTTVGAADLVAFLGSQDGYVYAVNAKTGATLWQSASNFGLVQGSPAGIFTAFGGAYNLIFAGSRVAGSGNSIYGINPSDGTDAWSFGGTMGIISSGATVDYATNRLYFASRENSTGSNNTLWCISFTDSSASLVWSQAYGDIDSAPVLYDGVLYVGTNAGVAAAIDPDTGGKIWSYATQDGPVKGYVNPEFAVVPRKIIFATTTSVWALTDNGASGSFEWQQNGVSGPSIPLSLVDQGTVYVGSTDGSLYQLNSGNGNVVTSTPMGAGTATIGSPGYDWMNSLAYVGAEDGSVYAVTLPLQ